MKKFAKIGSTIFTASLLMACVALWSCQKEVEPSVDPAIPTTTQMLVNAGIDKTAAPSKATGIRDDQFRTGDAIGLYVIAYRKPTLEGLLENDGNYVDNAKSTKGSASWTNSPLIYYPTVKVDMYAYYPYDVNFTPTTTPATYKFAVKADQASEAKVTANDFMTAQLLARVTQPTAVDMKFYHRMSKLDVKFTLPATYQGRAIASLGSVTFKAFKDTATVDLIARYKYNIAGQPDETGEYPKPAEPLATSTNTIDISPNKVDELNRTFHYEAIVVPQTRALGIGFVEIVVNYSGSGTEKFIYVPTADVVFQPSRSTVINIEFQPDNTIVLGTVDIKGWDVAPTVPGTGVEREVFNDFILTLPLSQVTQIKTVDVVVLQGTGINASTMTYTFPSTHIAGQSTVPFAFDGTRKTPDFYPFKIVSILCRDAAGLALTNVSCANKDITASGNVSLTGTDIPII